ncbi:integral membrane sensor signal transduction histidine kinase [Pseudodesulfovibrio mercurii]|uniref:histidine kinase n=1 Tax=Pseudodesulfovibrio mercurii TaxID=641491 RepID=F0JD52_9BACT|nr:ATP-binding protein [Pseudodesulfovibrio mercurii]EGB14544.1 integral membrane sensor signal transduction histidine kinase [Pseudodesulfovibrio mercurii]
MSLTYARRVIMLGRSAYPVSCLAVGAAAWFHGRTGDGLALAAALAIVCGMWLLLFASSHWLGQAEAERDEMGEQLIQSQRVLALGELSTGIAHEINNPLNIILQEAELMRYDLALAPTAETMEEVRSSLDVIYAQVSRCSDITHKLLDLARNRKPVSQPADINRLVEDMLELVEREAGPREIHLHRRLSQDLPTVISDPPLLRQVILNLLINAIQAVDKDGDIFITTHREGNMAYTEIRDTGPGISEENRKRIFNPFFTTKAPGQGTGLGLSVSLRIINELGGDIQVASAPGKGATFTVRIPIKR